MTSFHPNFQILWSLYDIATPVIPWESPQICHFCILLLWDDVIHGCPHKYSFSKLCHFKYMRNLKKEFWIVQDIVFSLDMAKIICLYLLQLWSLSWHWKLSPLLQTTNCIMFSATHALKLWCLKINKKNPKLRCSMYLFFPLTQLFVIFEWSTRIFTDAKDL